MDVQAQLFSDELRFPYSQDLPMENSVRGFNQFSITHQQKPLLQYQQSMQYQHPQIQSLQHHGGVNMAGGHQTMPPSQDPNFLVEKQRLEIDRFIVLENERLKLALQEQRKQLTSLVLKKYESKIEYLVKQKDEKIARGVNKTMELEDFLKRIEIENQTWQKIVKENEEMIFSLNNTIEQLRGSICLPTNEIEDAESCCDVVFNNRGTGLIEVKQEEKLEDISQKVLCKGCKMRRSSIVMLPCRHLCICESCEAFLHSCLACGAEKKATIQAFI